MIITNHEKMKENFSIPSPDQEDLNKWSHQITFVLSFSLDISASTQGEGIFLPQEEGIDNQIS